MDYLPEFRLKASTLAAVLPQPLWLRSIRREGPMSLFTVHLPKADYAELSSGRPDPARAVFVAEGFSRGAFIFGPLWLLSCGLWLAFLVWLVVIIALTVVAA